MHHANQQVNTYSGKRYNVTIHNDNHSIMIISHDIEEVDYTIIEGNYYVSQ